MYEITVREEKLNLGKSCQFAFLSDLHFSAFTSSSFLDRLIVKIESLCLDFILLGGDLVDHKSGLDKLGALTSRLKKIASVLAIPGNHDDFVGTHQVSKIINQAGGIWLENGRENFNGITIDGALHENPPDNTILCAHNPNIFPKAVKAGYKTVLAGHLHGGQVVLYQFKNKLYPAAFFYQWNGTRFDQNESTMLVSRGLNDTIPIRWNCPREILLCKA